MSPKFMTQNADLAFLGNRASLPVFSAVLVRGAVTWAKWRTLRKTRKTLRDLDAHLLADIGISQDQAKREAAKPFWMM